MTDQELIKRLRHGEGWPITAADRIEELVKERDDLGRKLNTARYGQPDFAWSIHEKEMAVLRFMLAECEARLSKAVEALRHTLDKPRSADQTYASLWSEVMWEIRFVVAELEGK